MPLRHLLGIGAAVLLLLFLSSLRRIEPRAGWTTVDAEPAADPAAGPAAETPSAPAEVAEEPRTALLRLPARPGARGCSQENPVQKVLLWLCRQQNADGSWGADGALLDGRPISRVGITGLALLSLLGAGYSHLSKDAYEDGTVLPGRTIKEALLWLKEAQQADGSFAGGGDGILDQAIASLALGEAYGMTGTNLLKESAERAVDALIARQGPSGHWGDPTQDYWAVCSLASAKLSDFDVAGPAGRALQALRDRAGAAPSPGSIAGLLHLERNRQSIPGEAVLAAMATASLDPADPASTYYAGMAVYRWDGPDGPRWKAFNAGYKQALLARYAPRQGGWEGADGDDEIVKASLATLGLEIYYRYANVPCVR